MIDKAVKIQYLVAVCHAKRNYLVAMNALKSAMKVDAQIVKCRYNNFVDVDQLNGRLNAIRRDTLNNNSIVIQSAKRRKDVEFTYAILNAADLKIYLDHRVTSVN